MKQRLSKRAAEMTQGGIRAFFDKAAQYPDAIHLGIGEPDFPTPPEIIEAAERALRDGYTHYTPNAGLPEAREAAADYLARYGVRRDRGRRSSSPAAAWGRFLPRCNAWWTPAARC